MGAGTGTDTLALNRVHVALVVMVLVGAAALRLVAIDNPSFHPHSTRQYRSAIIARAKYYALAPPRDEAEREAGVRAGELKGALEPPLTETLAAAGYAIAGRETPVVPRLLCSVLWLAGGLFVYSLARRLLGSEAALVALSYQVLSPHSVIIGRSFQPEALLVASLAGALLLMVRHHRSLAVRDLWLAGAATALSIVAKPVSVFFLVPAFCSLGWLRHGARGLLSNRATWLFLGASVGVPVASYAVGALTVDTLREQASMSLGPSLLLTPRYWR
ncbi:MAG TPA: glycosyltransferase family 39 protein, partial [Polyangiaceae bacterium]